MSCLTFGLMEFDDMSPFSDINEIRTYKRRDSELHTLMTAKKGKYEKILYFWFSDLFAALRSVLFCVHIYQ